MATSDLKLRTKDYALAVIRLYAELPKRTETQIIGRQFLRSGTSVGAQYREASRAKSNADFMSKIEVSLQELEETEDWLELLGESGFVPDERLAAVKKGFFWNSCEEEFTTETPSPQRVCSSNDFYAIFSAPSAPRR